MTTSNSQTDNRKRLYTLLAVGKEQLGWDDEFYYGIWLPMQGATKNCAGCYSATTMSIAQLFQAVETMKKAGFRVKQKPSHRALADDAQSKMIRGLWLELHELGAVRDPSEASLANYVKRQTGVEALQWLNGEQSAKVIEALKQWRKRVTKTEKSDGQNENA
ncbi:regulatory protein GemA [Methylomicrobium sp. Wu6]|uniref:gp16 family protein n=1 Tax=Methylomicrobium sp. Wu6 TaxID=3107928 RepID=UPI002DD6734F|nr:regulatory protein GemA [Methylomicrobium sp. Wu6]MEC4750019.1 regulatory protein GemA [Methylomicrobium sp. Wu6]